MNKTLSIALLVLAVLVLGFAVLSLTSDVEEGTDTRADTETPEEENGDDETPGDNDDAADLPDSVDVYVAELEAGTVGCGDAIVPIERDIEPTMGVLVAALEELFTLPDDEFGPSEEYYNALENADLEVESATVEDGVATVRITGEPLISGTCDAPRFEAQITQTVLQFETVDSAEIFVNDTPLEELFDARG